MDLKCNKTMCLYNKKYCCYAKEITILKETECGTYEKDQDKNPKDLQDVSKDMFEAAPDISSFRHIKDIKVNCKANCIFNNEGHCKANGITILENKKAGICGTFVED